MASFDERSFPNELPDYKSSSESLIDSDDMLANIQVQKLRPATQQMLNTVLEAYKTGQASLSDGSVYTGTSGVALLLYKVGMVQEALQLVEKGLANVRCKYKDCTYLCGDSGPLATAAVIYNKLGGEYLPKRDQCIKKILDMEGSVCESKSLPNEMLYGRAGYLYTLLKLQKEIGEGTVNKSAILNVASAIIRSGQELAARLSSPCPLMYTWYDEVYAGAAHGHAGILYLLLKVSIKYPELSADSVLLPTIDYLMSIKFPSGNYPSSLESREKDKLVHWCHGAPGFIYMFAAAYQKYQKDKYLKAAVDCAKLVWKRGLLSKGYGLCHGVSGNAYAFLCAYNLTGKAKYLHRALQFAIWCCSYGSHGCKTPDRPFSLFEGMAGTAYFLHDMLDPKNARFPAFEF